MKNVSTQKDFFVVGETLKVENVFVVDTTDGAEAINWFPMFIHKVNGKMFEVLNKFPERGISLKGGKIKKN